MSYALALGKHFELEEEKAPPETERLVSARVRNQWFILDPLLRISVKQGAGGDSPRSGVGSAAGGDDDEDDEDTSFKVYPQEGVIEPYSEVPVAFTFSPTFEEVPPAFKSLLLKELPSQEGDGEGAGDDKKGATSASTLSTVPGGAGMQETGRTAQSNMLDVEDHIETYQCEALITSTDNNQQLLVPFDAKAVKPRLELSHRTLRFGECPVYDRRDVEVTLRNPSPYLPIDFAFNAIANFSIAPTKGTLAPLQSITAVATFKPSQLGRFSSQFHCRVADGLRVVPLRVQGTSSSTGDRKLTSRGIKGAASPFHPQHKFIVPTDPDSSGGAFGATALKKKRFTRPVPWKELLSEGECGLQRCRRAGSGIILLCASF